MFSNIIPRKTALRVLTNTLRQAKPPARPREEEKAKIKAQRAAEQERIAEMLRAAKAQADAAKNAANAAADAPETPAAPAAPAASAAHASPTKNRQR